MDVKAFLDKFSRWASLRPDIEGVALVGSYARDVANEESDVDLIILTTSLAEYFEDTSWAEQFGEVAKCKSESWGRVRSLRVFYDDLEVEYNFALPEWADIPVGPGTDRVVSEGMKTLFDPRGILARLRHEVDHSSEGVR